MYTEDHIQTDPAGRHLALLRDYRDTVERLFPALTKRTLDELSTSSADALFVGLFMDHYPHKSVVLEKGVLLGTSTFLLAGHPKVSRVVGVDQNPRIPEDALDSDRNAHNGIAGAGESQSLETLDVARAALAEHAGAWRKIELHEGDGRPIEEVAAGFLEETGSTADRGADSSADDGTLIFLLSAPQGREEVSGELEAIFAQYPQAIVFLGNCRKSRGPFIQAGIADFMEEEQNDYYFRLAGDLGLGLAGSSLGVVYPDRVAKTTDDVLGDIGRQFSERLDPLRLLEREEELLEGTNPAAQSPRPDRGREEELNRQISSLTRQIEHLNHHYSSRRYKLADAAMNRVSRLRSLKRFIR